jgi:hypothetical protein
MDGVSFGVDFCIDTLQLRFTTCLPAAMDARARKKFGVLCFLDYD